MVTAGYPPASYELGGGRVNPRVSVKGNSTVFPGSSLVAPQRRAASISSATVRSSLSQRRGHELNSAASAEENLDPDFLLGLVERGKRRGVRVLLWNTTSKYSTETLDTLCPWPFERAYVSSDERVVPCCFIGNPDVAEIGTVAMKGAGFAAVWFGPDFQAFQQAHVDGRIPDHAAVIAKIRKCERLWYSSDRRRTSLQDNPADRQFDLKARAKTTECRKFRSW